jgi:hypothetical protein
MKIKNYIYPGLVYKSLTSAIEDLNYHKRYKTILDELEDENKLEKLGIRKEGAKLFIGVNLNPELLMYTEDSQESVELKFVSDAMKKYTDFLGKEGILDSIKADYERVFNDDFYGYVVQISYSYRSYKKSKFKYDIGYSITTTSIVLGGLFLAVTSLL